MVNIPLPKKILAQFHESNSRAQVAAQAVPAIPPIITPTPSVSTLPPHIQAQYRTATPPASVPTPPAPTYGYPSQPGYPPSQGYPPPVAGTSAVGYAAYGGQPQPQPQPGYPTYPPPGYTAPPPPAAPAGRPQGPPTIKPEMLAAFPEEQKVRYFFFVLIILDAHSLLAGVDHARTVDDTGTAKQTATGTEGYVPPDCKSFKRSLKSFIESFVACYSWYIITIDIPFSRETPHGYPSPVLK